MIDQLLGEILSNQKRVQDTEKSALEAVRKVEGPGGARASLEKVVQNTDTSISQIHARAAALGVLLDEITKIDGKDALLIPRPWLTGLD